MVKVICIKSYYSFEDGLYIEFEKGMYYLSELYVPVDVNYITNPYKFDYEYNYKTKYLVYSNYDNNPVFSSGFTEEEYKNIFIGIAKYREEVLNEILK